MLQAYKDTLELDAYINCFAQEFDLIQAVAHAQQLPVQDGFEVYFAGAAPSYILDLKDKFTVRVTRKLYPNTTKLKIPGLAYSSLGLIAPLTTISDARSERDLTLITVCVQGALSVNTHEIAQGDHTVTTGTQFSIVNSSSHWAACLFLDVSTTRFS